MTEPAKAPPPAPREELCKGKFIAMYRRGPWEYVDRVRGSTAVGIIALTPENRVLFISQHRVPLNAAVIEIPAGLVGDEDGGEGETYAAAALRELREETGWQAKSVTMLSYGPLSPGLSSECVYLVRAEGLSRAEATPGDGTEDITVHEVPLEEAPGWLAERVREGALVDPKVYAALYFLGRAS